MLWKTLMLNNQIPETEEIEAKKPRVHMDVFRPLPDRRLQNVIA
jgi:hypothetical protein